MVRKETIKMEYMSMREYTEEESDPSLEVLL